MLKLRVCKCKFKPWIKSMFITNLIISSSFFLNFPFIVIVGFIFLIFSRLVHSHPDKTKTIYT